MAITEIRYKYLGINLVIGWQNYISNQERHTKTNKDVNLKTDEDKILKRWREHFEKMTNT